MNPRHARTWEFVGGPLDGLRIEAIARTAIFRDANGDTIPSTRGDRLIDTVGLYAVSGARPNRKTQVGRYKWHPPIRKVADR